MYFLICQDKHYFSGDIYASMGVFPLYSWPHTTIQLKIICTKMNHLRVFLMTTNLFEYDKSLTVQSVACPLWQVLAHDS